MYLQEQIDKWNDRNPIGARVEYRGAPDAAPIITTIRDRATLLPSGPAVWVMAFAEAVELGAVKVIKSFDAIVDDAGARMVWQ